MTRKELINSREYWMAQIQISLFQNIDKYLSEKGINKSEFAKQLNVTKGYISQVLNGDFDHRISKLVDLSLAIGMAPIFRFDSLDSILNYELSFENNYLESKGKPMVYFMNADAIVTTNRNPDFNMPSLLSGDQNHVVYSSSSTQTLSYEEEAA